MELHTYINLLQFYGQIDFDQRYVDTKPFELFHTFS